MSSPETNCQVLGFVCSEYDLCSRCDGTGNEPTKDGRDPCCSCEQCFDEEIGWSTGIEPGSSSQLAAREYVKESRCERVSEAL